MAKTPKELLQELEDTLSDMDGLIANGKIMIYGPSGVGKTVLAFQLAQAITPPDKTIVYVDAVEGWVSLLNHPELKARTKRLPYDGVSQLETLALAAKFKQGSFANVGTVIFDEYSTMTKKDLATVVTSRAATQNDKDPDVPATPDYLSNTRRMERAAYANLAIEGINVIFVAHVRYDALPNGSKYESPAFSDKLQATMKEVCHVVAHMTADDKLMEDNHVEYVRYLQVHPSKKIAAKSRAGGFPIRVGPGFFVKRLTEWLSSGEAKEVLSDDKLPSEVMLAEEKNTVEDFAGFEIN